MCHVLFSLRTFVHGGPAAELSPPYLSGLNLQAHFFKEASCSLPPSLLQLSPQFVELFIFDYEFCPPSLAQSVLGPEKVLMSTVDW